MIDSKLHLISILRDAVGANRHACVVDQVVESLLTWKNTHILPVSTAWWTFVQRVKCVPPTVVDILGKLADRFGVGQIQQLADDLGPLHLPHDVTGGLLPLRHVSARQDHPCPCDMDTAQWRSCVSVCIRVEIWGDAGLTFRLSNNLDPEFHAWATSLHKVSLSSLKTAHLRHQVTKKDRMRR